MVANVRRPAARVVANKETWPAMVMKRLGGARLETDLEDAHKGIFENDFVALGRGLHGVEAVRESGFVLSVGVKMPSEQNKGSYN